MKNCEKCGFANQDEAMFCASCGTPLAQAAPAEEAPVAAADPVVSVDSTPVAPAYNAAYSAPISGAPVEKNTATLWLILNIVLTVLCCGSIPGIIGIVFAALGTSSYGKGNYEDMRQKTKVAKILFIVGIVLGVIGLIVGIATGLFAAITNRTSY